MNEKKKYQRVLQYGEKNEARTTRKTTSHVWCVQQSYRGQQDMLFRPGNAMLTSAAE